MRNFLRLAQGMDTSALVASLACQPELWNAHTARTQHPRSAHRLIDDVLLRYSRFDSGDDFVSAVCATTEVVDYPAWYQLPQAHPFIFGLMGKIAGVHLGRCFITRLAPGLEIPLHSDRIAEAELAHPDKIPPSVYYSRYHVVLASAPGVVFECGDESAYMATGEAWWFNNQLPHRVVNNSAEDRLHLIIDIRVAHDNYIPA